MTFEEYIKKLFALKDGSERQLGARLPDIEKQAMRLLMDFIDDNLDLKNGEFVANERAAKALQNFTDYFMAAINDLGDYKGAISGYLKNFKTMADLMADFQKSQGRPVAAARIGAVQEIVVAEIIDRYTNNGLNKGFVQPLRELLFTHVSGGLSKKAAMNQLRDYIESGKDTSGKLGRYLVQTAQQGVDSYTGAINARIMQTYKVETYIMSGSLIATSSKQCRYGVEKLHGIIDRKDWPKLKAIAETDGLIEGTTFDNLPINKLHWGCRHEFTPVVLTPEQRKRLLQNPVNS